jgi:hypothetical protein
MNRIFPQPVQSCRNCRRINPALTSENCKDSANSYELGLQHKFVFDEAPQQRATPLPKPIFFSSLVTAITGYFRHAGL